METEALSSTGIMFIMVYNLSSWDMLVYRDVTSLVAYMVFSGSLSIDPSFFRKTVVSFKCLVASVANGKE